MEHSVFVSNIVYVIVQHCMLIYCLISGKQKGKME